jgi:hypothetical protein
MGNIKEEAKRIENQGKEFGSKVDREGKRLEKKTGVPKEIWIGLAVIIAGAVLIKVFGG